MKGLGAAAELPDELRHPHALRHTCATQLLRAGATVADMRVFLGHASVRATSVYLASGEDRQGHVVRARASAVDPRSRTTARPHEPPPWSGGR
jgi:site-specific recombinase XerD